MFLFPLSLINSVVGDRARALLDDGIVDVNLMDIDEDGYVCENHKGQNDEIHNALHKTYPLHVQRFPLPAHFGPIVQRVVALKYLSGMRRIFIRLSEVELTRSFVKQTLRNHDPLVAPPAFEALDFAQIIPATNVDHAKTFAFQMGQIMGLFEGVDIFTKDDIVQRYPTLEPFIHRKRDESVLQCDLMNQFRDAIQAKTRAWKVVCAPQHFVALLQVQPHLLGSHTGEAWNTLMNQSNGMVIDYKDLTVVAYPPAHGIASIITTSWPRDPTTSTEMAVLPNTDAVSVGKESHGYIIVSDRQGFESPKCALVSRLVSQCNTSSWPWKTRYMFFDVSKEGKLVLVASRSRFSHLFQSAQRLSKMASEMGLESQPS